MITERKLQVLAQKMLGLTEVRGATLDIFLLPHEEIKALKARFIKKKTEPNVLAFPEPEEFPHPERGHGTSDKRHGMRKQYLGEVYLNADILEKNPERAAPLLLHGILHLLGYDHIKKSDAPKMEAMERNILKKLEK